MPRPYRTYPPEWKARAISLCLHSLKQGWSVARFCRWVGISRVTMLDWLSDDAHFEQYRRAMETKALEIPAMAMDIVKRVIEGRPTLNADGTAGPREFLDPKAGKVALSHFEFRMMREIKRIYEPTKKIEHKHTVQTMSDAQIEEEYAKLQRQAAIEGQAVLAPPRKET